MEPTPKYTARQAVRNTMAVRMPRVESRSTTIARLQDTATRTRPRGSHTVSQGICRATRGPTQSIQARNTSDNHMVMRMAILRWA